MAKVAWEKLAERRQEMERTKMENDAVLKRAKELDDRLGQVVDPTAAAAQQGPSQTAVKPKTTLPQPCWAQKGAVASLSAGPVVQESLASGASRRMPSIWQDRSQSHFRGHHRGPAHHGLCCGRRSSLEC